MGEKRELDDPQIIPLETYKNMNQRIIDLLQEKITLSKEKDTLEKKLVDAAIKILDLENMLLSGTDAHEIVDDAIMKTWQRQRTSEWGDDEGFMNIIMQKLDKQGE